MLSILIPVYNFDVRAFVQQLHGQCSKIGNIPWEILLLDDVSAENFRLLNRELQRLDGVNYEELPENVGRSAIRNAMVLKAKYDHLLIMDCDGRCPDDQFVQRYVNVLDDAPVIYGGRIYPEKSASSAATALHWNYGSQREVVDAAERNLKPHKSFMTNNFLVHRNAYDLVKMDESLTGYGHEDTLFALELQSKGIKIHHIQNPLIHIGLEKSEVFLYKTQQGIDNLAMLVKRGSIGESVTLVAVHAKLQRIGLLPLVQWVVSLFEDSIHRNLLGPTPNLKAFDVYKLALFAKAMQVRR